MNYSLYLLEFFAPTIDSLVLASAPAFYRLQDKQIQGVFEASALALNNDLTANTLSVTIPRIEDTLPFFTVDLSHSAIADATRIIYSYYNAAGLSTLMYGKLAAIEITDLTIRLELVSMLSALNYGRNYRLANTCNHVFGSPNCGFDRDTVTIADTIAQIAPDRLSFTLTTNTELDFNIYGDGTLKIGVGDRVTSAFEIDVALNDQNRIYLWEKLPAAVGIGRAIELVQGCNKSEGHCKLKFDNFPNYSGIPEGNNFSPTELTFVQGAKR